MYKTASELQQWHRYCCILLEKPRNQSPPTICIIERREVCLKCRSTKFIAKISLSYSCSYADWAVTIIDKSLYRQKKALIRKINTFAAIMMIFSIMEESFRITRTVFFLFSNPADTILRITIEVGGDNFCLIDTFLVKTSYLS